MNMARYSSTTSSGNVNHSDIRRGPVLNIGTIVFGALFLYILISFLLYLTSSHVESYQVTSGPLAGNQVYTGLILRSERIVSCDTSGYITYYARENSKVRRFGPVYSVGPSEKAELGFTMDEESAQAMSGSIRNYAVNFTPEDFYSVYAFKYQLEGTAFDPASEGLIPEGNVNTQTGSMTIGSETVSTAPVDGVVSFLMDGYENFDISSITPSDLDQRSYHAQNLKHTGRVMAGEEIYKIVDSENWSVIIPLTAKQIVQLTARTSIRVKFIRDGVTQNAAFSILTMADGSYYGKLDFTGGMIRYIDTRFTEIELVTNADTGLKIPISSIVSKSFYTIPVAYKTNGGNSQEVGFMKVTTDENGKEVQTFVSTTIYATIDDRVYIDGSDLKEGDIIAKSGSTADRYILKKSDLRTLEGVYNMNKGYAVFRRISIIDKNEQFCIVERGTPYGIAQYDYIVFDSSTVNESDITV